jgi:ribonuclease VapC
MFLDASAAIAILAREDDHEEIAEKLANSKKVLFSPLAHYETCVGLARASTCELRDSEILVRDFLKSLRARTVELTSEIGLEAVNAFAVFGKGRHRARLNMGDCFAYACAKVHRVPLLCKGDDFVHTDIVLA